MTTRGPDAKRRAKHRCAHPYREGVDRRRAEIASLFAWSTASEEAALVAFASSGALSVAASALCLAEMGSLV